MSNYEVYPLIQAIGIVLGVILVIGLINWFMAWRHKENTEFIERETRWGIENGLLSPDYRYLGDGKYFENGEYHDSMNRDFSSPNTKAEPHQKESDE